MIVGGYNIIDFGGQKFSLNQNIKVDKSIVEKLKDTSKPCIVGNFEIASASFNAIVCPMSTGHYIVSGSHTHSMVDITLSVTGDDTIMFGA